MILCTLGTGMIDMCLALSEDAPGRAAVPVEEDPPRGAEGEEDDPGQHQEQRLQAQPLPLPLPSGRQGIRGHYDTGSVTHRHDPHHQT